MLQDVPTRLETVVVVHAEMGAASARAITAARIISVITNTSRMCVVTKVTADANSAVLYWLGYLTAALSGLPQ